MKKACSKILKVIGAIGTTLLIEFLVLLVGLLVTAIGFIIIPFSTIRDAIDGKNYSTALSDHFDWYMDVFSFMN